MVRFRIKLAKTQGCPLAELGAGEWNMPQLSSLLKATASGHAEVENYEMDVVQEGHSPRCPLDTAADLPREFFPLPLLNVGGAPFVCPGSLVRMAVDPSQPLAFGMPADAIAFVTGGEAFDVNLAPEYNVGDREVRVAARFAAKDLLASGYVSGEKAVLGKAALVDARFGAGHVVMFAFRPQFRGQPFGTFKFLLNAVYLASARTM